MNVLPAVRLRPNWQCLLFHLAGALFAGIICVVITINGFFDFYHIVAAICSGLMCFYFLIRLLNNNIWLISDNKLMILTCWGTLRKEVPLSAIKSWEEIAVTAWYGKCFLLTLYTTYGNFELNTRWYKNYYPLRAILCRDPNRLALRILKSDV
jgi:hypothetical protein